MESNQKQAMPNAYDAFTGEIQMVAFKFAPQGWALCDGKTLQISQYPDLYTLIGTDYGGDGKTTFALPNLKGRFPLGLGEKGIDLGDNGGASKVTLTENQMPKHSHAYYGSNQSPREASSPENRLLPVAEHNFYTSANAASNLLKMNVQAISTAGESQPHDNMPPYLCINFIICLRGIFPNK